MREIPEFKMPVPLYRFRVMFADGELIDVIAPGDSNNMRKFALDTHKNIHHETVAISGVACLGLVSLTEDAPATSPTFPPTGPARD